MPLAFPPSPSLDQIEPYNGKNWRWTGAYWSAASQYAVLGQTTFQTGVASDWREIEVTLAANPVEAMVGVHLYGLLRSRHDANC